MNKKRLLIIGIIIVAVIAIILIILLLTSKKYTVAFDSNGGTEVVAYENIHKGDKITPPEEPTMQGYDFIGWYKEESLTTAWIFGTDKVTADTVLYAKWSISIYTLSIDKNIEKAGTSSGEGSYEFGSSVTLTSTTRNGFLFDGWYDGETKISEDETYIFEISGNTSIIAKWIYIPTANEYFIFELINDGTEYNIAKSDLQLPFDIYLPTTYNGLPVTQLAESAFSEIYIKNVFIPEGYTHIGNGSFALCFEIESVELPSSLICIGENAFSDCEKMTNIELPSGITEIGEGAFYCCKGLTSIVIPSDVTRIETATFYYCESLTSVEIPYGITTIEVDAFMYCYSLTDIVIPSSVTDIGLYAFHQCTSLTNIVIPSSVTNIGYYVFGFCSSLTNIVIPSSVTNIEDMAFRGCSQLQSVTVLNLTPVTLGENVFEFTHSDIKIYVPSESVDAYKNAWDAYADKIFAIE